MKLIRLNPDDGKKFALRNLFELHSRAIGKQEFHDFLFRATEIPKATHYDHMGILMGQNRSLNVDYLLKYSLFYGVPLQDLLNYSYDVTSLAKILSSYH